MTKDTAYLSNVKDYICFTYGDKSIRFKGPYSLVRFDKILEWDNGYIVVMAKFTHSEEDIEDYIDLMPILDRLYIDAESFLENIKKVEIDYAGNVA